jgi:hypothetical protein
LQEIGASRRAGKDGPGKAETSRVALRYDLRAPARWLNDSADIEAKK